MIERPSEEEYFRIAHDLIEEHGGGIADFVNGKVTEAIDAVDCEAISRWSTIRSAVAITLGDGTVRH